MKPPFKVNGRINYARKNVINSYLKNNEEHTIMLCGRVCRYDTISQTYTWWQYGGVEIIKAEDIWETVKKYNEQGRATIFSS